MSRLLVDVHTGETRGGGVLSGKKSGGGRHCMHGESGEAAVFSLARGGS